MKSIFVTGLHRSGTTVLGLILGTHSECVVVGEVFNVLRRATEKKVLEKKCTCGSHCEFWTDVLNKVEGREGLVEKYRLFTEIFGHYFPKKIIVDTSKRISAYRALSSATDCTPIHIIRDVRGYCFSHAKKTTLRMMLRWYRGNKDIQRQLNASTIGYETLVHDPYSSVRHLCRQLNIEYEPRMLQQFNSGNEHILIANRAVGARNQQLKYDNRWMKNVSIYPILCWRIMAYNKKWVY